MGSTILKKEKKKRAQSRVGKEGCGHGRSWKKSKYQNKCTKTSKGIHFPTHKAETYLPIGYKKGTQCDISPRMRYFFLGL